MKLIAILSKTIEPGICRDCRQAVTIAERDGGGQAIFSGDPAGFKIRRNANGDLVDHFDEAELHGCQP